MYISFQAESLFVLSTRDIPRMRWISLGAEFKKLEMYTSKAYYAKPFSRLKISSQRVHTSNIASAALSSTIKHAEPFFFFKGILLCAQHPKGILPKTFSDAST
jgi:hypothetical protein